MNNVPPSYVPPGAPPRQGPNCWLVGGLTCLGIVILVAIALFAIGYKVVHGPMFQSVMHSAKDAAVCRANMRTIHAAIDKYHTATGSYPSDLQQLVPTYITDASILHCSLDGTTDPTHVSYVYTKPAEGAPASTPMLALHWQMKISVMGTTQTQEMTDIMTVGGEMEKENSQPSTTYPPTRPGH